MNRAVAFVAMLSLLGGLALPSWPQQRKSAEPPLLQTELDEPYFRWVTAPGDLYGFWDAVPPTEAHTATGAQAFSVHQGLQIARRPGSPGTPEAVNPFKATRDRVVLYIDTPQPVYALSVLVSTAFSGAAGAGRLYRVEGDGSQRPIAENVQIDARRMPWLLLVMTAPAPPGRYALEIRAESLVVDVWPVDLGRTDVALLDPASSDRLQPGRALIGWVQYTDGAWVRWGGEAAPAGNLAIGALDLNAMAAPTKSRFGLGLGEHNNPYFVRYPEWFCREYPQAFMRDAQGRPIEAPFPAAPKAMNPMPAVDDPTLTHLSSALIWSGVQANRGNGLLAYWVIGGEEAYPEIFGLQAGDYRSASLAHYHSFLEAYDLSSMRDKQPLETPGAWYTFREQAFGDRAATYMQLFLSSDAKRPVFHPTHGNMFYEWGRRLLGFSPAQFAGNSDGFETGQITIDNDEERLNLLTLIPMSAYHVPIVTPRLANKTLDAEAIGDGRSFTPIMLRRLVYECLGLGLWHIGLVTWDEDLPDGQWHIKDTPAEKEAEDVFKEIDRMRSLLAGMGRLQPQVGLYISDATWLLEGWDARWSGFFYDALRDHWHLGIVGDAVLNEDLATRMPVLISIENPVVYEGAISGLKRYLAGGGRLYTWGAFAEQNAHGGPLEVQLRDLERSVVELQIEPETEPRTLVNRASTIEGAFVLEREYSPLPLSAVESAVRRTYPRSVLRPFEVDAGGKHVETFPLTDGVTMLIVLVNHDPRSATVRLGPPQAGRAPVRWKFREALTGRALDTTRGAALTIEGHGTAVVWAYPDSPTGQTSEEVDRAMEAVRTWRALGADIETQRVLLEQAQALLGEGQLKKASALARRITSALGISAKLEEGDDSALKIIAQVFDVEGEPVDGATVQARVVPAFYQWLPLKAAGKGRYTLDVTHEGRPLRYDVYNTRYVPLEGPVRLIVRARTSSNRGGALVSNALHAPTPAAKEGP